MLLRDLCRALSLGAAVCRDYKGLIATFEECAVRAAGVASGWASELATLLEKST